jgi:hypothetical protein
MKIILLAMRSLVSRKKNSAPPPSSRTEEGCRTAAINIETASSSFPNVTFPMPQRGPHRESDLTILPIEKGCLPTKAINNNKADRGKNDDDNIVKVHREGWSEGVVGRGGGRKGWSEEVVLGRGGWKGWWRGGPLERVILGFHRKLERVVNNEDQERLVGRVVLGGTGRRKRSTKAGTVHWSGSSEMFKEG